MKMFLRKTGQEVFPLPWVAESPRPWLHGYHRVYVSNDANGAVDRHKSGLIGHVYIVKDANLLTKK